MGKRLTPIERLAAGQSPDKHVRYLKSLPNKGLTRVAIVVPIEDVDRLKAFAGALREASAANRGRDND